MIRVLLEFNTRELLESQALIRDKQSTRTDNRSNW